jgi:hypothetical protein
MKKRKQLSLICLSILLLIRTVNAQSTFMATLDNDDNCPTEGTAFDSNEEDVSLASLCSYYWVGAKTKSIKKTQNLSTATGCLDYFVPFVSRLEQCASGGSTEVRLYFDQRVSLN